MACKDLGVSVVEKSPSVGVQQRGEIDGMMVFANKFDAVFAVGSDSGDVPSTNRVINFEKVSQAFSCWRDAGPRRPVRKQTSTEITSNVGF